MSILPTDAFPDPPDFQPPKVSQPTEGEVAPLQTDDRSNQPASGYSPSYPASGTASGKPFYVRAARQQDLTHLAELLTSSFHSPTGAVGWLYPLLRQGIYEDMRMRLRGNQAQYACLVAVRRMSPQEAIFESRALESAPPGNAGLNELQSSRLVGTVEISLKTGSPFLRRPPFLYLSNLAVLAEYRGQGVAQQLLRVCERVALDWGFQDLYLHVLEDNARARRLYSKAGYEVERIETSLTSMLLGRSRQMFLHKSIARSG